MGDDAIQPVPARSGCFRWTCGCLAVAAVLSLAVIVAGWYTLSRWTPAGSAWENLPTDTLFALEANGVDALLETAAGDDGALSLAGAVLRIYQGYLEDHGIAVEGSLPQTAYEFVSSFSWLYTTFFPNYLLFGMRGFDPDELFVIAQPPRWFAWTVGAMAEEGVVEEVSGGQGTDAYLAFVGDHVVIGLTEHVVRHVVDSWDAKAAPLGKGAGRGSAYVMLAAHSGERSVNVAAAGQGGGIGNFALRDPFAAPAATQTATRFQAIVTAAESGWNIAFENIDAEKPIPPAAFAEHIDAEFSAVFGADNPKVVLPDDSDVELALRMPKETLEQINSWLANAVPPRFGRDWLRHGWLDRAGGMFTLLTKRPVVVDEEDAADGETGRESEPPPYPPLPVLTLGWNLSSLHAPVPFANYLGEWLDALRTPGGVLPQSMAQALLSYETAPDRLAGAVSVPPVFANGARPAWKFMLDTLPSMGWMATDPSGLPEASLLQRLAAPALPEPAADRVVAVANWDMSRVFIDAMEAVAADRLRQLPDEWELWSENLPVHPVARLFTAYPRGAVKADVNTATQEAAGKAFIPFGMSVDIE